MPVGVETFRLEPVYSPFRKISVLKTAPCEDDPFYANPLGNVNYHFGESVVKFRGDHAGRNAPLYFIQNLQYCRLPVDHDSRLLECR